MNWIDKIQNVINSQRVIPLSQFNIIDDTFKIDAEKELTRILQAELAKLGLKKYFIINEFGINEKNK